jgi:methylthioribose-1-phosphate isomerase
MKIDGKDYRSIWLSDNGWSVNIFDQRELPWKLKIVDLASAEQVATAIKEMWTRGAPLLAMAGAYGLCMALREDASDASLKENYKLLLETRPTAINLKWALDRIRTVAKPLTGEARVKAAYQCANDLCDEDVRINKAIGQSGLKIIRDIAKKKSGKTINILTHCNAGWLATVDYGTALAPIYLAHDEGIPVHVWVDETRPRNQGALLTAYELAQHGVPHTVIVDNAGGHYMQKGQVDLCIVGTDRVARNGDVCNKIGTYLKALAAFDNNVPFYVALPYTTFDESLESGADIPIEERNIEEVTKIGTQKITASKAANPGFDITPVRLVTAYITEKGIINSVAVRLKRANA